MLEKTKHLQKTQQGKRINNVKKTNLNFINYNKQYISDYDFLDNN